MKGTDLRLLTVPESPPGDLEMKMASQFGAGHRNATKDCGAVEWNVYCFNWINFAGKLRESVC